MNYQKHYSLLIERARNRILDAYTERHHIIPRCLGGRNKKENLVSLTPEEHFVAHQLLVKIYPDNHKLIKAAVMMSVGDGTRKNNKRYGWLRKKHSKSMIGNSYATASKGISRNKGRKRPDVSIRMTGLKRPTIANHNCQNKKGNTYGKANKGKKYPDRKKLDPITCPHCNKTGSVPNMKRYHFDNCKLNYEQ